MCGIFGVCSYQNSNEASKLTFFGLNALQHRGQESVGIAVNTGSDMKYEKCQGMVSQVFREDVLEKMIGKMAVGHVRYSTSGDKNGTGNIQPYLIHTRDGPILIAHNGELTEADKLRQRALKDGRNFFTTSDTETIVHIMYEKEIDDLVILERGYGSVPTVIDRIGHFMSTCEGVYSLIIITLDAMYAVRDSIGVRPLCIGTSNDNGHSSYIISSESCAINTVSGKYIREVLPGEIVKFTPSSNSIKIESFLKQHAKKSYLDAFEFIYFSRPDTILQGAYVHDIRKALGEALWKENQERLMKLQDKGNYVVMGVPDSATPMAIGFSNSSGFLYDEGFTKNRYIHRTFIAPAQNMRKSAVKSKFNPLPCNIRGKRILLIDDSIVRGTTIRHLVKIFRDCGANEIHVLIGSPPVKYPHYMGIDLKTHSELIAAKYQNIDEINREIGSDTLSFLSLESMLDVLKTHTGDSYFPDMEKSFCINCWSGNYPLKMDFQNK